MADPTRISTLLQTATTALPDQIGVRDSQLAARNRELADEVARLRLRVLELEGTADMDPLLPVYNRRAFMREVSRAQAVMTRYGFMSCVLFLDLDGFKAVNDRYGHGVGDQLLERVADSLLSGVRGCDMVARIGGDEFGVLLFKCDHVVAKAKAASLACRIGNLSVDLPDARVSVSASWGAAPCDPRDSAAKVLERADRAMYLDKRSG